MTREVTQAAALFEFAEIFDGFETATLDAFWQLNAFDDEAGYRSLAQIAESMGVSERDAEAALAPLVKLDWVDFSDDLLTEDGEPFGAGYALYEDGLRVQSIYEALQYSENRFLARHRLSHTEGQGDASQDLEKNAWAWLRENSDKYPEDTAYGDDEMVDAFMAGHDAKALSTNTQTTALREAQELLRECLEPLDMLAGAGNERMSDLQARIQATLTNTSTGASDDPR